MHNVCDIVTPSVRRYSVGPDVYNVSDIATLSVRRYSAGPDVYNVYYYEALCAR